MRLTVSLLALSLLGAPAVAQTTTPAPSATPPATPPAATSPAAPAPAAVPTPHKTRAHSRMTLQERFDRANTTHDGKLTLDQAKTGLPSVAKNFSAIDKDKKGYVTVDEIRGYRQAHRRGAHRGAAHHAASSS